MVCESNFRNKCLGATQTPKKLVTIARRTKHPKKIWPTPIIPPVPGFDAPSLMYAVPPPTCGGPPPLRVGIPPPLRVGDPPPHAGPHFFGYPTLPHARHLANFVGQIWALAGNGSLAARILRPCVGREEHWHREYILRKGFTWPDSPLAHVSTPCTQTGTSRCELS